MNSKSKVAAFVIGLFLISDASAESYPFSSDRWQTKAEMSELVEYRGQEALLLKGGSAVLSNIEVLNGVIEFDISVKEERGFSGSIFRAQDDMNFEHFYIRPHQSGNPDANQYTPVINGVSAWQLYHGEGYGAPINYRYEEWMHIKIVFSNSQAEVFIDSDDVAVQISELKRDPQKGSVGVNASNFASAYFANFELSPLPADYEFAINEGVEPAVEEGIVSSWLVSDAFDGISLNNVTQLGDKHKYSRSWLPLHADNGGITNLARIQGLKESKNTAFARFIVSSDRKETKALNFGYSDFVAVFANGTLLYRGSNFYESRDYRYLGTIGLFDAVYLPLEAGDNEIWFAITEAFGGWGIKAQFDDLNGIEIKDSR